MCASVIGRQQRARLLGHIFHQAHGLGDVQVYAQNIDRFFPENAEQLAFCVIRHDLFQFFLAQTGGGGQSGDLDAGAADIYKD